MWMLRAIRVLLVFLILLTSACGGGGGESGAGGGLGLEGTGFKLLITGQIRAIDGGAVEAADLTTDDASTSSDRTGRFAFETGVVPGESIAIQVSTQKLSRQVVLEPVFARSGDELQIELTADLQGGVIQVESQRLIPSELRRSVSREDLRRDADVVLDQIGTVANSGAGGTGNSSVKDEALLDPDFVGIF